MEEDSDKTFAEVVKLAASFDGIEEPPVELLSFSQAIMSTPVKKNTLSRIISAAKGSQFLTVWKELKEIEKKQPEQTTSEAQSTVTNVVKVMEGMNDIMRAQQKLDEGRRREEKMRGWNYREFKLSKNEKFTAGDFKFYLSGLNDYMQPRELTDEEKIQVVKFRIGPYISDLVRVMPTTKGMTNYKEFCDAILAHINPNFSNEAMKLAFLKIRQEENESNGKFMDKLKKYSEMVEFAENEDAEREILIIQNVQRNGKEDLFKFAADFYSELPLTSFGNGAQLQNLRKRGMKLDERADEAKKKNRSLMKHEAYRTGKRLSDEHTVALQLTSGKKSVEQQIAELQETVNKQQELLERRD